MNGHLAKNGIHHDEGFINPSEWSWKAKNLFRGIGSTKAESYFKHTEPQLMALCVFDFLNMVSLTKEQFIKKQPLGCNVVHSIPEVVEIFVSRAPCNECNEQMKLMNGVTTTYGFKFELIWASVY
jgi:hypothetical protein